MENNSAKNGCPLSFLLDGKVNIDTLHKLGSNTGTFCNETRCKSALMKGLNLAEVKTKQKVYDEATDFINQYYDYLKKVNSESHLDRLKEVQNLIKDSGTYELTTSELEFGARTAWRNASRCINRIHWSKLKLFDERHVTTAEQMFDALKRHVEYGCNNGNIRPAITVFRQRTHPDRDFRYAGYNTDENTIIGDPQYVEFTQICEKLGWKGQRTNYDLLPLIIQADGGPPELFELPKELAMEVDFSHPEYEWFSELNLKWIGIPSVTDMMLDVGGIQFSCSPFNGWFLGTEIGRDFADTNRYNKLTIIAEKMGLDTKASISLWKDRALIELNVAILYSFQKAKITIVDHHSATESFVKHYENEVKQRGGCPGDWIWLVPPISGHVTPVFHLEMLNYMLKPSLGNQPDAWKTCNVLKRICQAKLRLKSALITTMFASIFIVKLKRSRTKCTILYATETGRSETFAKTLCHIFNQVFSVHLSCVADFDLNQLANEQLVIFVSSTYGNGDAPVNGESIKTYLDELEENQQKLSNLRYSVFGLGDSSYPQFCEFGKLIDRMFETCGAKRIHPIGLGDYLDGQEDSFNKWAHEVFEVALNVFGLKADPTLLSSFNKTIDWQDNSVKFISIDKEVDTHKSLQRVHKKKLLRLRLIDRKNLQHTSSGRRTLLVTFEPYDTKDSLVYKPADHIGLCPANRKVLVDSILERIVDNISPDQVLKIKIERNKNTLSDKGLHDTWLSDCSLREALTYFCDITTVPNQKLLSTLATLASSQDEIDTLKDLSSDNKLYEAWKNENNYNLSEILNEYPSIRLTAKFIMTQLARLKYRLYSISSSPNTLNNQVQITSVVVEYLPRMTSSVLHYGVCTKWLEDLNLDQPIFAFIREAPNFRLPDDNTTPVIMVGAGTGIAPFRSLWQERRFLTENVSSNYGDMVLYFGCRSNLDELYRNEVDALVNESVIGAYHVAYSRFFEKKKAYVQDKMIENSVEIFDLIYRQNAHFYICGDVRMAADVTQTLETIISNQGALNPTETKEFLVRLKLLKFIEKSIRNILQRKESL